MKETPPILRRDNKYRLILSALLIVSMVSLTISTMQVGEVSEEVEMSEEWPTISAGVNKAVLENTKELKKRPESMLGLKIEKLELATVTVAKNEPEPEPEPEIHYKNIEEIEISRDMDLTKTIGISREDFCQLLANFKYDYNGFYKNNAGLIWDLSQEYQVNEIFMCAVFALESYYGSSEKHIAAHNYGSIMNRNGELVQFATDEEGIEANFKLLARNYLSEDGKYYKGVTLDSIGDTYCPPTPECPSWANKVYKCMKVFVE